MAVQNRHIMSNGKITGFDNDADFIPFDLSDDDFDKSRPESRSSIQEDTEGDSRKRKRNAVESSPERGPPAQRQKTSYFTVNPWQTDIDDYASLKETARMLHKEVQDFTDWILPTSKEAEVRAFVVKRVKDAIETKFPMCQAYTFGSFSTKLYHPDADIDIMVDWPGHTWDRATMRQLGKHLERRHLGRNIQCIFGAKVPIIKFVDTYAQIDIDLSFNQTNALQVVTLVQNYLREMPATRPLVMVLKTLFHQHELSIPADGGLGSYSLICMIISFLQRHPKIAAGHIRAEDNLGAMLLEILELYGTRFNFDKVGLAIDNGGSYFHKGDYEYSNFNVWKKICIRDPNDPLNNVAKASFQIDNIVRVFRDAYRGLTTRCFLVHARIQEGAKAPWGTQCGSLLDAIIDRPGVSMRERLRRVWKPSMSGDGEEEEEIEEVAKEVAPDPTKRKKNRAARRAAQQLAKKEEREKQEQEKDDPENRIQVRDQGSSAVNDSNLSLLQRITKTPPTPRTHKKKKSVSDNTPRSPAKTRPPPANESSGTKDEPIILTSPTASPRPELRRPRQTSAKGKSKGAYTNGADSTAENLTATGSVSEGFRETILIE